jgi:hypothetical protein
MPFSITETNDRGDCRRCARVSLKSLVIDGNRKNKGRIVDADLAGGLIVLGGNEGPSVTDCVVRDPRHVHSFGEQRMLTSLQRLDRNPYP